METLISVRGVSKKFCRDFHKSLWFGVRDIVGEWRGARGKGELREGEFWANRDLSFDVARGRCLGLVGPNGAGKTTLLRLIGGLLKPDAGSITVRGSTGALIALGAGFNPLLTGRENIFISGAIHGMGHKEIRRRFDEIVAFAEVEHALDAPVQSYSVGMRLRLGFAVAASLEPDVLLLDEVLAVGDAAFRNKCYRRISELKKRCAVVFVSHMMEQVESVCDELMLLDGGRVAFRGSVDEGIQAYLAAMREAGSTQVNATLELLPPLEALELQLERDTLRHGGPLRAVARVRCSEPIPRALLTLRLLAPGGMAVAEARWPALGQTASLAAGDNELPLDCGPLMLRNGRYSVGLRVDRPGDPAPLGSLDAAASLEVNGGSETGAWYQLR